MSYFKSLSKNEKKQIKTDFLGSKTDSLIYHKINKIYVLSLVGIILALCAGLFDYLYKTGLINYILDGLLMIFSIIFFIKTIGMKNSQLNKYALSKKNSENKESKKNKK